jgi:hypothetical protein
VPNGWRGTGLSLERIREFAGDDGVLQPDEVDRAIEETSAGFADLAWAAGEDVGSSSSSSGGSGGGGGSPPSTIFPMPQPEFEASLVERIQAMFRGLPGGAAGVAVALGAGVLILGGSD